MKSKVCGIDGCKRRFTKKSNLTRHQEVHAKEKNHECPTCEKRFNRGDNLLKHRLHCERSAEGEPPLEEVDDEEDEEPTEPEAREVRRGDVPNFEIRVASKAFKNANVTWELKYPPNKGENYDSLLNMSMEANARQLGLQSSRRN